MAYRGEDLDLKVPTGRLRALPGSDAPPRSSSDTNLWGSPDATLWVDETVLACCNNAFDLALAYGAGEVRLAHLLHALTRVEAAVRILDQRGIGAAQLRHESAVLIVNESPVPLTSERNSPRRSVELEDTLRHAVDMARRRGAPAGVEDVLFALASASRSNAAVELLRRLAPDLPIENALAADPSGRLDLIEDTLRGIHAELAGDRKLLSDLVRDLQREVASQRGDNANLSTALRERLTDLAQHLRATPEISDKLNVVEQAVRAGMGEGARNWAAMEKRLQGLEAALRANDIAEPIARRLAAVEQVLQERANESVRSWVSLADRVQSLEKLYQAGSNETARHWSTLTESNAEILKSLSSQGGTVDAGPLVERIEMIERTIRSGLGDTVRASTLLADRVGVVERVVGTRNDTQSVMLLDERLRALESMIDGRARETGGRWSELVERLKSIEGRVGGAPSLPSAELLSKPVVSYLASFSDATAARDDAHAKAMAELGGRVAAVEHVLHANNAAISAAAGVYDRNADELHEGFARLGENQHTLASTISDWRADSTAELRSIAGGFDRLKVVEERLESLVRHLMPPPRVVSAVETYTPPVMPAPASRLTVPSARWAAFRRWLFGTEDVGRANAAAEMRWQRMRDEVRTAASHMRKR